MNFDKEVKSVIMALSDSVTKENFEENQNVFNELKRLYKEEPSRFLDALEIGVTKFDMLLEEVFEIPPQKNQHIIKFIANGLFEHFHETRICKLEGLPCSADKSSFVRNMTLKALETKQNLSLFADYKNIEQIKEDKERQAYWSPKSIKDTDEAIQLFWDWYEFKNYKA